MIKKVEFASRKIPLLFLDFNETRIFFERFSKKEPNTNFHENPSSGSRVVPCRQTDMKKLIAALGNFAKALKKHE